MLSDASASNNKSVPSMCLVSLDNLDFELATLVADGVVQTSCYKPKLVRARTLITGIIFNNSHTHTQ